MIAMTTLTAIKPARTIPKISANRLLQASGEFSFRFEELSLEIEGGFSAGSFNGTAQITWWDDDDGLSWFVGDIILDCHRWNGKSWDVRHVDLEQHTKLYIDIWSELTDGSFKDSIEAKVEGEL